MYSRSRISGSAAHARPRVADGCHDARSHAPDKSSEAESHAVGLHWRRSPNAHPFSLIYGSCPGGRWGACAVAAADDATGGEVDVSRLCPPAPPPPATGGGRRRGREGVAVNRDTPALLAGTRSPPCTTIVWPSPHATRWRCSKPPRQSAAPLPSFRAGQGPFLHRRLCRRPPGLAGSAAAAPFPSSCTSGGRPSRAHAPWPPGPGRGGGNGGRIGRGALRPWQ